MPQDYRDQDRYRRKLPVSTQIFRCYSSHVTTIEASQAPIVRRSLSMEAQLFETYIQLWL